MLSKQNIEILAQVIIVAMTLIGVYAIAVPFWMFDQSEAILKSENSIESKDKYEKSLTALAVAGGSLTAASLIIGFLAMNGSVKTLLDNKNYAIYLTICAVLGLAIIMSALSVNQSIDETAESEQIGDGFKPSMLMNIVLGSGVVCGLVAIVFLMITNGFQGEGRIGTMALEEEGEFGFDFEF